MTSMIKRIEHLLVQANSLVMGLLFFAMFVLVFTNVVTRYCFGFSINWAEELSRYMMIWMAYLGAGLAMREGRHVAIEFVQDRLPKPLRRLLRAFVGLVILVFMGFVAVLGYQYSTFAMKQETAALQWPMGLIYIVLPIGALAFMLHLVTMFGDYIDQEPSHGEDLAANPEKAGGIGA